MTAQKYSFKKAETLRAPLFPSWRLALAITGLLGGFVLYSLRVNMSLAIVCMAGDPIKNETQNTSQPLQKQCGNSNETVAANVTKRQTEFTWDRTARGYILSSFFIGYLLTQVLGGYLSKRFSGRWVIFTGVFVLSLSTLFIPIGARTSRSPWVVAALRVVAGAASGIYFASFYHLWSLWAPPLERTKLITLVLSGNNIGSVVMYTSGGYLCENGFDGGWPSIFYIFGIIGILWCILWLIVASDTPASHGFISNEELEYIQSQTGKEGSTKVESVPWFKIFTCVRVWCIFITHFCYAWTGYTVLTMLPQYIKDILLFDVKANGVSNAMPYVSMFLMTILAASVADKLMEKNVFSATVVRKIIQTLGFIPPAVLSIVIGYLSCEQSILAVVLLCISVAFTGCSRAGVLCNMVEVAPRFGGVMLGISNTIATTAGIFSPMAVSAITRDGTPEQWRNVFFLSAGFYAFGELVFLVLASSEPQPWALLKQDETVEMGDTSNKKSKLDIVIQADKYTK